MSEGLPHHAENPQQKQIGIFISVLAVIMAIVSAVTNQQANHTLAKKVESSNGFAFFQAKKQRSFVNEIELKRIEIELKRIEFELAGTPSEVQRKIIEAQREIIQKQTVKITDQNAKYEKENEVILAEAKANQAAAELAEHKHHWFEISEICLHIAVVLCSLVLLTELRIFLKVGILVTVAGLVVAGYAHFGKHSHHAAEEGHAPAATQPAGGSGH